MFTKNRAMEISKRSLRGATFRLTCMTANGQGCHYA